VNRGRSDVLVAFTDTGVDTSHPDISANLDLADSRSFITAPDRSDPAYTLPEDYVGVQDYNGHGTWVASAVAAPINGIGISGVAPGVTIVALKTQDATGNGWLSDWADAVRYAANIGVDVVSSSIYTYVPTCGGLTPSDCAGADSDYIVAQRAVDYARARGTLVIAALGNENRDVGNTSSVHDLVRDYYGVDFPGPWITAPGGLNGVVGVSATGYFNQKAVYSNYGLGVADIAAPGGDTDFQDPGTYPGGGTLIGAWTSTDVFGRSVETNCSHNDKVCAPYAFEEGTSMATPNVAGVAALIISQYGSFGGQQGGNGRSDNNGKRGGDGETGRNRPQIHLSPDRVEQILLGSAVQQSCPTPPTVTYFSEPFPGWPAGVPFLYDTATCGGSSGNNGFYGAGIANALAALTGNLRR
jgi:subtilisin family serine protease